MATPIRQDIAPLPHRDLRHPWLRYQVERYNEGIVHSYEQRLETIWGRSVNRVHVLDFAGLTDGMRQTLADRLGMVYTRDDEQALMSDIKIRLDVADTLCFQLGGARRRMTWRQFILALGLHTEEEMEEAGDFLGIAPSYVFIRDPVGRLCYRMITYSISGRGLAPEKVTGVDLFYLRNMDQGTTNVPYLLAQYLFSHVEGRKSRARLSGGHFIRRLAAHFGLVNDQWLRGLSVVASQLPVIDLHELDRLNICLRFGDTWAWVAPRPERQQAGAPGAAEDAPLVDEGAQAVPAPVQTPQPPPPAPQHQTMTQRIEGLEEEMRELRQSIAFDSTLVGSSLVSYQRCVRPRISDANTSTAPHTDDQPDP
ncbi:hypothetical protein Tco_1317968 [Tanacetum coccineum]